MHLPEGFLAEHRALTRRYFLAAGAGTLAAAALAPRGVGAEMLPELAEAVAKLESYLTLPDDFYDVSRGKPIPHTLSDEQRTAAGLTRETWRLEVIADPEHPCKLRHPRTKAEGTALDFAGLMQLADKHSVRFAKVMTCLNLGCPLGMGVWEGVPLREVIWPAGPRDDLRRVIYYGYHNDQPDQMFKSSLPVGRVLEDPLDFPPVILCYKLNGQWLTPERGGPVRVVVPEAYGFKSIKWLSHVLLSTIAHANDTYAEQGNDVDSPLKTFAATLLAPKQCQAGRPIPLTGYAQVGVGGLSKVQAWIQPDDEPYNPDDRFFTLAPWRDMEILPPPERWGGGIDSDQIPAGTLGFDPQSSRPRAWPMRLTKAHWAGVYPPLTPGKYTLRCRAVDSQGHGQPLPRPFRKSGHASIEELKLTVA